MASFIKLCRILASMLVRMARAYFALWYPKRVLLKLLSSEKIYFRTGVCVCVYVCVCVIGVVGKGCATDYNVTKVVACSLIEKKYRKERGGKRERERESKEKNKRRETRTSKENDRFRKSKKKMWLKEKVKEEEKVNSVCLCVCDREKGRENKLSNWGKEKR